MSSVFSLKCKVIVVPTSVLLLFSKLYSSIPSDVKRKEVSLYGESVLTSTKSATKYDE